jgi:hypothetical protein
MFGSLEGKERRENSYHFLCFDVFVNMERERENAFLPLLVVIGWKGGEKNKILCKLTIK